MGVWTLQAKTNPLEQKGVWVPVEQMAGESEKDLTVKAF
jgi:hypothetical protein